MAMTKRELIKFMDELVELVSEENKSRAILVKEKFISDFEKSYEYEKEVQTEKEAGSVGEGLIKCMRTINENCIYTGIKL